MAPYTQPLWRMTRAQPVAVLSKKKLSTPKSSSSKKIYPFFQLKINKRAQVKKNFLSCKRNNSFWRRAQNKVSLCRNPFTSFTMMSYGNCLPQRRIAIVTRRPFQVDSLPPTISDVADIHQAHVLQCVLVFAILTFRDKYFP